MCLHEKFTTLFVHTVIFPEVRSIYSPVNWDSSYTDLIYTIEFKTTVYFIRTLFYRRLETSRVYTIRKSRTHQFH